MYDLEVLKRSETDRRAFLTRMSAAGLGAAAVALLAGCGGDSGNNNGGTTSPPSLGDTKDAFKFKPPGSSTDVPVPGASQNVIVLNYALTLEYLEADLYRQALNIAAGVANPATAPLHTFDPTPGSLQGYSLAIGAGAISDTNLQAAGFAYLVQFAYVEAAHRDFLLTVLGPAASPLQGPTKTYHFPTGTDSSSLFGILSAILPLEETGVRAYLGAGKYLQDNPTVQTAVSIYSTECRHSASIEYILNPDGSTIGPRRGISGVPSGEFDVASAPGTPTNLPAGTTYDPVALFEKALTPESVLSGVFPLLA